MKPELRRRLVEAVGAGAVKDGELVVPRTAEQVAAVCRLCHESGLPVSVASGDGAQRGVVAGVLLSLRALDAITVDAAHGVLRAQAGAKLAAVAAAAGRAGTALAATADGSAERLGSALAVGSLPRRAVLSLELVLSDGTRVRTGSELPKDVTGYDLTALVLGSRGAMAVIVEASLRLAPHSALPGGLRANFPLARGREGELTHRLRRAFDPLGRLRPDLER
ncbi:MAG: FAD-binding oxidoreductase [Candidatus Dormibacteria bacterium]